MPEETLAPGRPEMDPDLFRKLKVIASGAGLPIRDALTRYGGPGIDREYKRMLAKMSAELTVEGK